MHEGQDVPRINEQEQWCRDTGISLSRIADKMSTIVMMTDCLITSLKVRGRYKSISRVQGTEVFRSPVLQGSLVPVRGEP